MTRVKICGITNLEDARAASECGAHALGFIFVPGTPRYIGSRDKVALFPFHEIPPFISRVMVCRDAADARDGAASLFDAVQYYAGRASLVGGPRCIRAIRVRGAESLEEIAAEAHHAHALLLDAYHPDRLGGSGAAFDWDLAREAKARFGRPIILAGGLTPDNVGDAIAAVRPYAVDVSSGVEAEPGRKDHAKLRAFLRAVRRADAALEKTGP